MRNSRVYAAHAVLAVLAAGCGADSQTPDLLGPPVEPVRPFAAAEQAVADASNAFGIALLRQVVAESDEANVLLSPLSASLALGMTLNGAEGDTYDAMRSVLGFDGLEEAEVNDAYRGLMSQLVSRDDDVEFRLANAIWYRAGFEVKQPFLDAARTSFYAQVAPLDFADPAAPGTISRWAEQQTGGRIRELVERIDPLDMLFLVNAVYFKAPWSSPFQPQATRDDAFARADGAVVTVPMMQRDGTHPNFRGEGVQIVELLYADSAFSMVLVAPTDDRSLDELFATLSPARWASWLAALEPGRVMLRMPKFRFEYDITMNDALSALGMGIAFDARAADFDRIHDQTRDDLYISKVRQKAFIDVHELGTEAAAATSVTVSVTSLPPQFTFDRPFLFAIRERASGVILFAGRVGDPSAE